MCGRDAVSILRKMFSSEIFPASCVHCGTLVASKRNFAWALAVTIVDHVIVFGSMLIAWLLGLWWPLVVGIAFDFFILPLAFEWWTSLKMVTPEQMWRYRQNVTIGAVVFVLLVIVAGLTDG